MKGIRWSAIWIFLFVCVQSIRSEELGKNFEGHDSQQQTILNENDTVTTSKMINDPWPLRENVTLVISHEEMNLATYSTTTDLQSSGEQFEFSENNVSHQGVQDNATNTVSEAELNYAATDRPFMVLFENDSHIILAENPVVSEQFGNEYENKESDLLFLSRNVTTKVSHLLDVDHNANDLTMNSSTTNFSFQTYIHEETAYSSPNLSSTKNDPQHTKVEYVNGSESSSFTLEEKCENLTLCKIKSDTKNDFTISNFNTNFTDSDSLDSVYLDMRTPSYGSGYTDAAFTVSKEQPMTTNEQLTSNDTVPSLITHEMESDNRSFYVQISNGPVTRLSKLEATHYDSSETTAESIFITNTVALNRTLQDKQNINSNAAISSESMPEAIPSNNDSRLNAALSLITANVSLNQSLTFENTTEKLQKSENVEITTEKEFLTTTKSAIKDFANTSVQSVSAFDETTTIVTEDKMFSPYDRQDNNQTTSPSFVAWNTAISAFKKESNPLTTISSDENSSVSSIAQKNLILNVTELSSGNTFASHTHFEETVKNTTHFEAQTFAYTELSEIPTMETVKHNLHFETINKELLNISNEGLSKSQFPHSTEETFHSHSSGTSAISLTPHEIMQTESSLVINDTKTTTWVSASSNDVPEKAEILPTSVTAIAYTSVESVVLTPSEHSERSESKSSNTITSESATVTTSFRLFEGVMTSNTLQLTSRSDQELSIISHAFPVVLNVTTLYKNETSESISDQHNATTADMEESILLSDMKTVHKTTSPTFTREFKERMQDTNRTTATSQGQSHITTDEKRLFEITSYSTHSVAAAEETLPTKFVIAEDTVKYTIQQKTLFFQREIGNLSTEELNNIISVVFHVPQEHQDEDLFVLYVAHFNDWLIQTIKKEKKEEALDPYSNITTIFQTKEKDNRNINFVEVVYILPSPNIQGEDMIFTFFCRGLETSAVVPYNYILQLISSEVDKLQNKLSLELKYLAQGLHPLPDVNDEWTTLHEDWKKYGILLSSVGFLTVLTVTILIAAIVYLRCKSKQSTHYISEMDKLQVGLQVSLEEGNINPAAITMQDEIIEKDSAVNGNHICYVDDDEGWLVPLGDVPLEDISAPDVQDTKL